MFRAFCAEPRIPSRLKLAWRWALRVVGDFRADLGVLLPFVAGRAAAGMSTEKVSLLGAGKEGLTALAAPAAVVVVAASESEWGESPVDEGDIVLLVLAGQRARGSVARPGTRSGTRSETSPDGLDAGSCCLPAGGPVARRTRSRLGAWSRWAWPAMESGREGEGAVRRTTLLGATGQTGGSAEQETQLALPRLIMWEPAGDHLLEQNPGLLRATRIWTR